MHTPKDSICCRMQVCSGLIEATRACIHSAAILSNFGVEETQVHSAEIWQVHTLRSMSWLRRLVSFMSMERGQLGQGDGGVQLEQLLEAGQVLLLLHHALEAPQLQPVRFLHQQQDTSCNCAWPHSLEGSAHCCSCTILGKHQSCSQHASRAPSTSCLKCSRFSAAAKFLDFAHPDYATPASDMSSVVEKMLKHPRPTHVSILGGESVLCMQEHKGCVITWLVLLPGASRFGGAAVMNLGAGICKEFLIRGVNAAHHPAHLLIVPAQSYCP